MRAPPSAAERQLERPASPTSATACPRCGAACDADQEYCLECGLRLPPVSGVVPRLGAAWRTRLRWYPGDWLWPVLGSLALAAAGAAGAILVSKRGGEAQTLVATSPPGETAGLVAPTGASSTNALTNDIGTGPTITSPTESTPPTSAPPPPPPKQARPLAWPRGKRGYTVVLASVPNSGGRTEAVSQARQAIDAGLTGVGILDSSNYSSLHPGYLVIFTGARDSQAAASPDLRAAQTRGYAGAYVRQITP